MGGGRVVQSSPGFLGLESSGSELGVKVKSASLTSLGLNTRPAEDLSNVSRMAQAGTPSLQTGILCTSGDVGPSPLSPSFLSTLIVKMRPYISATSTHFMSVDGYRVHLAP